MITDDKVRYVSLNKNFVDKIVKLMEERNEILKDIDTDLKEIREELYDIAVGISHID